MMTEQLDNNDLLGYVFGFEGSPAESYVLERGISKETAELLCNVSLPISKSKATAVKQAYLWSKR